MNVLLWLWVLQFSLWSVYKGGRTLCPNGYVLCFFPGHQKGHWDCRMSKRTIEFLQLSLDGVFSGPLLLLMFFFSVNLHEGTDTVRPVHVGAIIEIHSFCTFSELFCKTCSYTLIFQDKSSRSQKNLGIVMHSLAITKNVNRKTFSTLRVVRD